MAAAIFFIAVAAVIAGLILLRNSKAIIFLAAGMLAAFPIYNDYAYNSCEGGCNIRVDLLLVLPILLAAIILALRKIWMLYRNRG